MVKATVILEDEIYKKLVKEAVEKYGRARSFSRLINEKLKKAEGTQMSKSDVKKRRASIAKETFGIWKIKETGAEYVRKLRDESEKRLKRMGL